MSSVSAGEFCTTTLKQLTKAKKGKEKQKYNKTKLIT